MDINQNTQQINTFVKGMNTDTSDAYISKDLYRYAENVRISTNVDSNSGELRLIEGLSPEEFIWSEEITNCTILATNSIRGLGIVILKKEISNSPSEWALFKIDFTSNTCERIFGWSAVEIWGEGKSISTILRWESDKNVKVYIADGIHLILQLEITHGDLGCDFTSVFGYQQTVLPTLNVSISNSAGRLDAGIVQYAYRLYKRNGAATVMSTLSKPLSLYKNSVSGYAPDKKSGRAVTITYPTVNQSSSLNYIQVYRISFTQAGSAPKISLIKDEPINAQSTIDTGGTDIKEVPVSEFLSLISSPIKPKIIESKGDYLFAANLKYDLDEVDKHFSNFDARSYSKGSEITIDGVDYDYFDLYHDETSITLSDLELKTYDQNNQKTVINIPVVDTVVLWLHSITYNYDENDYRQNYVKFKVLIKKGESTLDNSQYVYAYKTASGDNRQFCVGDITNGFSLVGSIVEYGTLQTFGVNKEYLIDIGTTMHFVYVNENDSVSKIFNVSYSQLMNRINPNPSTGTVSVSTTIKKYSTHYDELNINSDQVQIKNKLFPQNGNYGDFNSSYWEEINIDGVNYNGVGKCINWKYEYTNYTLSLDDLVIGSSLNNSYRTYRRGEIYRFGIRLYDSKGRASSVKWIADIMIPTNIDAFDINSDTIVVDKNIQPTYTAHQVGIKFYPTGDPAWNNVSAYEIVLCERTLEDKFTISQGIIGNPLEVYKVESNLTNGHVTIDGDAFNQICHPGYMTTDEIKAVCWYFSTIDGDWRYSNPAYLYIALTYRSALMFASPEYSYQPDDLKLIVDSYKSNLYLHYIALYTDLTQDTGYYGDPPSSEYGDGEYRQLNMVKNSIYGSLYSSIHAIVKDSTFTPPAYDPAIGVRPSEFVSGSYSEYYFMTRPKQRVLSEMPFCIAGIKTDENYQHAECYYDISTDICDFNRVTRFKNNNENYHLLSDGMGNYSVNMKTEEPGNTVTQWFFNFIKPAYKHFIDREDREINNISYIDSPEYSDFAKDKNWTFKNNVTTVGTKSYINWSTPFLNVISGDEERKAKNTLDNDSSDWRESFYDAQLSTASYPVGAGGKMMIFSVDYKIRDDSTLSYCNYNSQDGTTTLYPPSIQVCDLKKHAIPYGGYNKTAIDNSTYLSIGFYQEDKTQPISVYGGDSFIKMFTYNALHNWHDSTYKKFNKMATVYCLPVETDIDLQALFSDNLYNQNRFADYRVQDKASSFNGYTQAQDAYLYNTAYNITPDVVSWSSNTQTEAQTNNYDVRVHYSDPKTNNENVDSWLLFKAVNFKDVDTRYGEITGMKLFKDRLVFWLENAAGILAVNERVVLKDSDDNQVTLGTGSVLERFDYITTIYGLKKDSQAYDVSDTALYWWDGHNKEILMYGKQNNGYHVIALSTLKEVKNYINSSPKESDYPSVIYDGKYKELLFNVSNNECIVYNEQTQQFTSVYTFNPIFKYTPNNLLYLTDTNYRTNIHLYNKDVNKKSKGFGDNDVFTPLIQFVVNPQAEYNKAYDIQTFGGRFYGGDDLKDLHFKYTTPLKQESRLDGVTDPSYPTNREYDFRLNIPRAGREQNGEWIVADHGDRMRGKTMQCEFKSDSNDLDFSLQYVITKFRMSWT